MNGNLMPDLEIDIKLSLICLIEKVDFKEHMMCVPGDFF